MTEKMLTGTQRMKSIKQTYILSNVSFNQDYYLRLLFCENHKDPETDVADRGNVSLIKKSI